MVSDRLGYVLVLDGRYYVARRPGDEPLSSNWFATSRIFPTELEALREAVHLYELGEIDQSYEAHIRAVHVSDYPIQIYQGNKV